jgi:PAS domain S-box-containing protein
MSKILEKKFVDYRNKIKSEEMEFRNLFQNSAVGLAISDINGKFIQVNEKFVDMLGYRSSEDFLDKSWKDISHNDFTQEESKTFDDLKSKKISKYSIEKVYVKEDGTVFDAYLSTNVFSIDNKMKYVLSSLIDITEIKTKDNLLFQQSKMASMGEMLANIAHQWRQPLSTISTASSGLKLQKEYGLLTDDNLISSLDTITASSKYLSQTIEDFRAFFSPSKERVFIKTEDIVSQTLNLIATQFKNKEITIIEDIESIEIESLKNELIQVLINILNNASDALDTKDYDKFIFINIKRDKNNVLISIRDNAGGIHKNIINRIFEPYFTTKHKAQGTGIGLYMVDEIIKKHINGKIKVRNVNYSYRSKFYTGVEFKIYIPISEKNEEIKIEK